MAPCWRRARPSGQGLPADPDLATKQSECGVDAVLNRLLEWNVPITPTVVADHLAHDLGLPCAMEVVITTRGSVDVRSGYSRKGGACN